MTVKVMVKVIVKSIILIVKIKIIIITTLIKVIPIILIKTKTTKTEITTMEVPTNTHHHSPLTTIHPSQHPSHHPIILPTIQSSFPPPSQHPNIPPADLIYIYKPPTLLSSLPSLPSSSHTPSIFTLLPSDRPPKMRITVTHGLGECPSFSFFFSFGCLKRGQWGV